MKIIKKKKKCLKRAKTISPAFWLCAAPKSWLKYTTDKRCIQIYIIAVICCFFFGISNMLNNSMGIFIFYCTEASSGPICRGISVVYQFNFAYDFLGQKLKFLGQELCIPSQVLQLQTGFIVPMFNASQKYLLSFSLYILFSQECPIKNLYCLLSITQETLK